MAKIRLERRKFGAELLGQLGSQSEPTDPNEAAIGNASETACRTRPRSRFYPSPHASSALTIKARLLVWALCPLDNQ
jgi:hypothetical protein